MSFNFRATFSPATLELCFQSHLHLTLIIKKCESNCSSVTFFAFKWKHKYTYIYRSEPLLLPLLPRVMQVCLQTSESGHMEGYSNTSSTKGLVLLWSLTERPRQWKFCAKNGQSCEVRGVCVFVKASNKFSDWWKTSSVSFSLSSDINGPLPFPGYWFGEPGSS